MPGQAEFSLETAMRFFIDEKSVEAVNRGINQIKSMAKTALGAIGIGLSLRSLNQMAEQYKSINLSLQSVLGANDNLKDVQEKIKLTARDVRGEYDKIAENVKTLVQNNKRVFDINTATRFTDIMYKLTKMSGGNNSQASAAVQSLSSAMRNGKIDRGAIDNLINNVPQAIKVLTAYYGVSQERLRSMAQAGLIRSAQIRDAFMQAGMEVDKAFENVDMNITDVLSSFRSEFMAFVGETDEMLGITKTLAKYIKQILDMAMTGLQKARSGLLWLSDKLGGMENVLKLLAILAGSFFVAFHFKDIISGLSNIIKLFTTLGLKGMAVVAVIALIALLIDDFIHFMKGDKESFFGKLFDAKGLDTDVIRKKINDTIDGIKNTIKDAWEAIAGWTKEHWPDIKNTIVGVVKVIRGVVGALARIVQAVFSGIGKWWDENGEGVIQGISDFFKKFKEDILGWVEEIKQWWADNGDQIIATIEEITGQLLDLSETIGKIFGDLWNILVDIINKDDAQLEADLKSLLQHIGEFLKGLLDLLFGEGFTDNAIEWGENLINNFVKGIRNTWERVQNFFKTVSNDIKRAFGLEVEEESETKHESESGVPHTGGGGSFGNHGSGGGSFGGAITDEDIQIMRDANLALRRANNPELIKQSAAQSAVNDSHNVTVNNNVTQNNTYEGGSMDDQRKMRRNMDDANNRLVDDVDKLSRDIAFSY